jgi:hypothetical protein
MPPKCPDCDSSHGGQYSCSEWKMINDGLSPEYTHPPSE